MELLLARDGRVRSTRFFRAMIRSKRRFSYEEAATLLRARASDPIGRMLHDAAYATRNVKSYAPTTNTWKVLRETQQVRFN